VTNAVNAIPGDQMTYITTRYNAQIGADGFRVEFVDPFPDSVTRCPAEFICDFDERDELIGIETLNLYCDENPDALSLLRESTEGLETPGRARYYEKGQAFYFNITGKHGPSVNQKVCEGSLIFDSKRRLAGLEGKY